MELLSFGDTGWGDELFRATLMTIAVAITAFFIGFIFAFIFVPLKLSKNKIINFIGNSYTTIFRGVPELLIIYLFSKRLSNDTCQKVPKYSRPLRIMILIKKIECIFGGFFLSTIP